MIKHVTAKQLDLIFSYNSALMRYRETTFPSHFNRNVHETQKFDCVALSFSLNYFNRPRSSLVLQRFLALQNLISVRNTQKCSLSELAIDISRPQRAAFFHRAHTAQQRVNDGFHASFSHFSFGTFLLKRTEAFPFGKIIHCIAILTFLIAVPPKFRLKLR